MKVRLCSLSYYSILPFVLFALIPPDDPVEIEEVFSGTLDTIVVSPLEPDKKELQLVAKLLFSECLNQSFEGKLAVANVVTNRVEYYGTDIRSVIFAKGQFDGIHTKYFSSTYLHEKYKEQYNECLRVARLALMGRKILPESVLFYHNKAIATDTKWVRRLSKLEYITIQDHTFCHRLDYSLTT